jgi:hypothetical protein
MGYARPLDGIGKGGGNTVSTRRMKMHYTFEFLVKGDSDVLAYYKNAVHRWNEIWQRPQAKDLTSMAHLLSNEQSWFEQNCGGRWVGQEIMIVSGFAMLYSPKIGFEDESQARFLYDAFQSSMCSVEVKFGAERVAESYDLIDSTTY